VPGTNSPMRVKAERPWSTSRRTAAAVNCIETEAMWNRVTPVFRIRSSRSAKPYAFRKTTLPSFLTRTSPAKFPLWT
jgi:hypothetical protein